VAEAMWKARPVLASRVGGIQDQTRRGHGGLLQTLLTDRDRAQRMAAAQAHRLCARSIWRPAG
jgi:hypothetical protein